MSRMIGPRAFPDGSASNTDQPARKPRRSPSDLRREAKRLGERQTAARRDRRDGWPDGKDPMAVVRQVTKMTKLDGEKRELRREVYSRDPELDPGAGGHLRTTSAGRGK